MLFRIKISEEALALIAAGADLNIQNKDGDTALTLACKFALPEVALTLITAGANINIQNRYSCTALKCARSRTLSKVALALAKSNNLVYDLYYAKICIDDVQKALSFNFSQYPLRYEFTLADTHLLNSRNFKRIKTMMLIRQIANNYLHILPMELMELLFTNLFS